MSHCEVVQHSWGVLKTIGEILVNGKEQEEIRIDQYKIGKTVREI